MGNSIHSLYRAQVALIMTCMTRCMHGQRRCFNAGVAATHSQHLTPSRAVLQHVMDAVDVVVGSPQALPKPLEAMLFQHNGTGKPPELPACGVP